MFHCFLKNKNQHNVGSADLTIQVSYPPALLIDILVGLLLQLPKQGC